MEELTELFLDSHSYTLEDPIHVVLTEENVYKLYMVYFIHFNQLVTENNEFKYVPTLDSIPTVGAYKVNVEGIYNLKDNLLTIDYVKSFLVLNSKINKVNDKTTFDLTVTDINSELDHHWLQEQLDIDNVSKVIIGSVNRVVTKKHSDTVTEKLNKEKGIDGVINMLKTSTTLTEHLEFIVTGENTGIGIQPKTDLGFYILPIINQVAKSDDRDGNPGLINLLVKVVEAANSHIKVENNEVVINQEVVDNMNKAIDEKYLELIPTI